MSKYIRKIMFNLSNDLLFCFENKVERGWRVLLQSLFKKDQRAQSVLFYLKKSKIFCLPKFLFENTWASTTTASDRPRLAAQLRTRDFFVIFYYFFCKSPSVERWQLKFGSNTTEKFEISRDEANEELRLDILIHT